MAKLQELQHNISTTRSCLGAVQNCRERNKQIVTSKKTKTGVRRNNRHAIIKADAERSVSHDPLASGCTWVDIRAIQWELTLRGGLQATRNTTPLGCAEE